MDAPLSASEAALAYQILQPSRTSTPTSLTLSTRSFARSIGSSSTMLRAFSSYAIMSHPHHLDDADNWLTVSTLNEYPPVTTEIGWRTFIIAPVCNTIESMMIPAR